MRSASATDAPADGSSTSSVGAPVAAAVSTISSRCSPTGSSDAGTSGGDADTLE